MTIENNYYSSFKTFTIFIFKKYLIGKYTQNNEFIIIRKIKIKTNILGML
jgi:hypothetical protein